MLKIWFFNVWTTICAANFEKRVECWNDETRIENDPYFGWLQTYVPTYGNTINIKTTAVEQVPGLIPEIKVIEEGHKLKADQENGITYKQATAIVDEILKSYHQNN